MASSVATHPKKETHRPQPKALRGKYRLYFLSLAIELLPAFWRLWTVFRVLIIPMFILTTVAIISTNSLGLENIYIPDLVIVPVALTLVPALLLAVYPHLASIFSFALRIPQGKGARLSLGARSPTRDEANKIRAALEKTSSRGNVPTIRTVFVVANQYHTSFSVGNTAYLSTSLIESEHLEAVLAFETGRLANRDSYLQLALMRLVLPLAYWYGIDRKPQPIGSVTSNSNLLAVVSDDAALYYRIKTMETKLDLAWWYGGLFNIYLASDWAEYWRESTFRADEYACQLGYGKHLVQLLEQYEQLDGAHPFLLHTRPDAKERIDRLQTLLAKGSYEQFLVSSVSQTKPAQKSGGVLLYEKLVAESVVPQQQKTTQETIIRVVSPLGLLGTGNLKEWVKADGATVKHGEVIAKITFIQSEALAEEPTATASGILRHKLNVGAEVQKDTVLAVIETKE